MGLTIWNVIREVNRRRSAIFTFIRSCHASIDQGTNKHLRIGRKKIRKTCYLSYFRNTSEAIINHIDEHSVYKWTLAHAYIQIVSEI